MVILGTFPNGIKPSPAPEPPKRKSSARQWRFAFLAAQTSMIAELLGRGITEFLGLAGACVVAARAATDDRCLYIDEIIQPKLSREAIVDALALIDKRLGCTEVFTDEETFQWLCGNDFFWDSYCDQVNSELWLESWERHSDPAIRQTDAVGPLERGEISLSEHLIKDARFMKELQRIGKSIVVDAIAGALSVSYQYR